MTTFNKYPFLRENLHTQLSQVDMPFFLATFPGLSVLNLLDFCHFIFLYCNSIRFTNISN